MPMTDVQDIGIFNFDIDRFRQGVESTVYPLAPAGYYAPGDPGFPGNTGRHAQWGQFSPRLGLAWDVRGDGRTSVRVSGSMTKESMPLQFAAGIAATAPPWAAGVAITDPIGGFADPYLGFPGGDPFPIGDLTTVAFPRGTEIVSVPYDFPNPTVYGWNLAVQQQIGDEWMVSGSYIGTQLIHLWLQGPGNRAIYFPGTASAAGECMAQGFTLTGQSAGATCSSSRNTFDRRVLSLIDSSKAVFGAVGDMGADGTQSYHGLIISIQRRAASGVTVNMNYTWSHCITDDIRGGTGVGNPFPGTTYTHFGDRTADRGNCQADRRHIVNLTSVARTPNLRTPRRARSYRAGSCRGSSEYPPGNLWTSRTTRGLRGTGRWPTKIVSGRTRSSAMCTAIAARAGTSSIGLRSLPRRSVHSVTWAKTVSGGSRTGLWTCRFRERSAGLRLSRWSSGPRPITSPTASGGTIPSAAFSGALSAGSAVLRIRGFCSSRSSTASKRTFLSVSAGGGFPHPPKYGVNFQG